MSLEKTFPIYRKTHASGNVGYRVDMGFVAGKRVFKHFRTEALALRFQQRCKEAEERKKPAELHFLDESTRHEVLAAIAKLRSHNATIPQAVDFFLKHARPANADAKISEIMSEFRSAKTTAGMSKKYLANSENSFFKPFKTHFNDCLIAGGPESAS